MLNCTKCDGKGYEYSNYAEYDQTTQKFSPGNRKCVYCSALGTFPDLDSDAIRKTIMSTRGAKRLRKSMVSPTARDALQRRAYYVWRMARFHGGADMTTPVMAQLLITGDPTVAELDKLADVIAREEFGSDLHAAMRWGKALGHIS